MTDPVPRQARDNRNRILQLLKRRGAMTAQELSPELQITPMGVRAHLLALGRDGLVSHRLRQGRRGRPSYEYLLTPAADQLFPQAYPEFLNGLIETIRTVEGDQGLEKLFEHRTETLRSQYLERLRGKEGAQRVDELGRIRSEQGYMAEVENVSAGEVVLRQHNCAIWQVAQSCCQACDHELELFQGVLEGALVSRIEHQMNGDRACTYRIRWVD